MPRVLNPITALACGGACVAVMVAAFALARPDTPAEAGRPAPQPARAVDYQLPRVNASLDRAAPLPKLAPARRPPPPPPAPVIRRPRRPKISRDAESTYPVPSAAQATAPAPPAPAPAPAPAPTPAPAPAPPPPQAEPPVFFDDSG